LLAPASLAVVQLVLADARPAALLALAFFAVVLANARPATLLAPASYAVVLAYAQSIALLAQSQDSVVLARAGPLAMPTLVFLSVVRALCALFLHSFTTCPPTAHSFSRDRKNCQVNMEKGTTQEKEGSPHSFVE
jgi:hypothetical protein